HKPELRPTRVFEAKYNKVKAKLALLSLSASASKVVTVKNKGLIAEAYEWDKEEVSSDDNEMVRRGEALQVKKAKALKLTKTESSNANRSKTPTKRHMTGVKSYLHKYVEQPGPKVVFGDDSTYTTKGYNSIKCNGIVFTKFNEKRGTIFKSNKEVVMIDPRVRDVYVLDVTSSAQESCFFAKAFDNLNWLWHKRLAHLNFKMINKLAKQNLVIVFPYLAGMVTRAMAKELSAASAYKCLVLDFFSEEEPKKVFEALQHPGWVDAMQDELNQFAKNKVWTLVPAPYGKTIVGSKWVFRNKRDETKIVIKNKARLVAQGYNQQEGIDYDETFAPVARLEVIRIFLAFSTYMNFIVYQIDVKNAFLNGRIRGDIGIITFRNALRVHYLPYLNQTKSSRDGLKTTHTNLGESKEVETKKDEDTYDTSHDDKLEQQKEKAKVEVDSLKARPSYLDINQLTKLLVTSLKPKLSKLLASYDFASSLPRKLKELPSKITTLAGEIQELKRYVQGMEIEIPGDLNDIPTKLETFTSTVSSLMS
nr:retrovirus-related Pol polyprotein from transposon TNT 1-94 [Tanacetum cinerariifolium]